MRFWLFFVVVFACQLAFGQDPLRTISGAAPPSFATSPDKLGSVSSSLNLFTGDLQFPIPLVSLPGRNGLDATLTLAYNSNVHRQANAWNVEAPTGVAGLGWSLEYPKIIVDCKMTGTREDDTYYINEGNSINKLVYVGGTAATGKVYSSKNYQFWNITFFPNDEKWEIVKEDGTKYIYGDKNSGRSTVQWIVTWNNWIGSSNVTTSTVQKQQGLVWNLSEIRSIRDERLLFSYLNINQKVGGSAGKEHTEASYLATITDIFGRTVNLVYANKLSGEYVEPHTENGNNQIDAYQERYEMKYLDYVNVNDSDGTLLNKVDLSYTTMGIGDMTKRLLTSIIQYNANNQSLPGYSFSYITNYAFNTNYGALSTMTIPTGGTINYTYGYELITRAVRERKINEIGGTSIGYAEPKVWIGPDYVVITRRELSASGGHTASAKGVIMEVFSWDGEWIRWDAQEGIDNYIKIVALNNGGDWATADLDDSTKDFQDFRVTMQKDFFAVLFESPTNRVYRMRIYRKNETKRGGWTRFDDNNISLATDYTLFVNFVSGENFVAVTSKMSDVQVFTWDGTTWLKTIFSRMNEEHNPIVAGPNYFISHRRGYGLSNKDEITFHFLLENGTWTSRIAPDLNDNYTDGVSNWHAGASFAVVLADDNNENIYNWDENYNILPRYSTGIAVSDYSMVDITNNAMVGILQTGSSKESYSYRYNGQAWSAGGSMSYTDQFWDFRPLQSYGDDFIVRPMTNGKIGVRTYNANTGLWGNLSYTTANWGPVLGGYNYFTAIDAIDNTKARLYMKKPNGSFALDPVALDGVVTTPGTTFAWQGGYDFVIKSVKSGPKILQSIKFKNGKISSAQPELNYSYNEGGNTVSMFDGYPVLYEMSWCDPTQVMATGNTLVTFLMGNDQHVYQEYAKELRLHRIIDSEAIGHLEDFPVQKISVNDGEKTTHSFISYDISTATYDAAGSSCQYNKVSIYPGVESADNSNGHKEVYFHNGLTSMESGSPFPSSLQITGSEVNYSPYSALLKGFSYRTKVVNSLNTVVSEVSNTPAIFEKNIVRGGVNVDKGQYVRAYTSEEMIDSKSSFSYFTYNAVGLPIAKTSFSEGDDNLSPVVENYKYWYEEYDPLMSKHFFTPVIQNKRTVNGIVTECSAVKYKEWSHIPGPYQSYAWKRTGSSDFTAWPTESAPSSDWRLINTIDAMEASKGLITQSTDGSGIITRNYFDALGKTLEVTVSSTSTGSYYYKGFEDCTLNCSTDAKTGQKSSTQTFITWMSFGPSDTYKVTYWRKTSAQAEWELVETTFTGTSYSVPDRWIDELRIYPVSLNPRIVSYGYDRFGNVISECDANNMVIYKEYDEFNRPKLTRDKDKKIRSYNIYNVRN